ncbi:MAG TPA: group II intron reverse transcriptase/maturase [Bdellovibrionales bacterium]|nr:group II intron reverse transcriptase/maturase [Bdellovibrionales bacterium]
MMNGHGKSDRREVPAKFANKEGAMPSAERDGGKASNQGEQVKQNTTRTQQAAKLVPSALDRVRKIAKGDKKVRFTNLMHHIYNIDRLRAAYFAMKRKASAGVDGETWTSYGESLEENLRNLSARLKAGGYRAKPVRRTFIAKTDGKQRPLGVPVLEDKIVQRATVEVLNAIYEMDFLGFSYGYRPGKGQHSCLDALYVGLLTKKVNWVLDADIRGFFDNLDHDWLVKFVEHRIEDKRLIRLIQKWLKAGVMQDGTVTETEEGVPQGGSISPLLANIYLHYVLDLWAQQRRTDKSQGEMIIVRWADDFVVGFEHKSQAEKFLADLKERMLKFGLELHPDKTRILEFGPWAVHNRKTRGAGKPETFNFLGFTHICAKKWSNGMYTVLRRTIKKKMRVKLAEVKATLRSRMHHSISEQGKWLKSVVGGHHRYYGVPNNTTALAVFRHEVGRLWYRTLKRRSQNPSLTWAKMARHIELWLPQVQIHHPYPLKRMSVIHPK